MTHDNDKWIPPSSIEEIIKNLLIPPRYYMRHLVGKNLRKGEPELHLLPFLVNRDKQAIDIGANKGIYTHLLARLVPFVHAFEPNPKMFNVLTRGLPENARSYEIALSDQSGSGELLVPKLLVPKLQGPTSVRKRAYANLGASLSRKKVKGEHGIVQIEKRTLDSYALDNVGFIKIDVEGYEQTVLKGAKETLMHCRPTILIELEERHTGVTIESLIEQVEVYGYQAYFLRNRQLTPVTQFDSESEHRSPETPSNYVNNFLFFAE